MNEFEIALEDKGILRNVTLFGDFDITRNKLISEFIKLDNNIITREQFDMCIKAVIYGKSQSFLRRDYHHGARYEKKFFFINKLFECFFPSEKQVDKMIQCYQHKTYQECFIWIDILIAKNYPFTVKHSKQILETSYDIKKIIPFLEGSKEMLHKLMEKNIEFNIVKEYIAKNKLKLNNDDYYVIIESESGKENIEFFQKYATKIDKKHFLLLLDNVNYNHTKIYMKALSLIKKIDSEIIDRFLEDYNNHVYQYLKYIIKAKKGSFTSDSLMNANICKVDPKFNLYELIIKNKVKPTIKHLANACLHNNNVAIDTYLSYGCEFNVKCLEYACCGSSDEIVKKILAAKIIPNEDCMIAILIKKNNFHAATRIGLLVEAGGIITRKVVEYSIMSSVKLGCLDMFDINYDEDLYRKFTIYNENPNSYPFFNKFKMDENILLVRTLCRYGNDVLNYISENKIEIDQYCLENSAFNPRSRVFKHMLDKIDGKKLFVTTTLLERTMLKYENTYTYEYLLGLAAKYGIKKEENLFLDKKRRLDEYE